MTISRNMLVIFVFLFLDIVTVSMILPWMPSLLETYESEKEWFYILSKKYVQHMGFALGFQEGSTWDRVFIGGLLSSLSSLMQFVSSPVAGALSDYFGRKPILIVLQVSLIIVNVFWSALGKSFLWLLIYRVLCGAARANVGVVLALVGDISSDTLRTKGMAVVGLAYGIGFTVGPPCSVILLSRWKVHTSTEYLSCTLGSTCLLLNCINLLILIFALPSTLQKGGDIGLLINQALCLINPAKLFSLSGTAKCPKYEKSLRHLAYFWCGYLCLYCGIEYTVLFLARIRFNFSSSDQGKMFGFIGIIMMLVQGCFIHSFKLGREDKAITWSSCCLILASAIFSFATNIFVFYIGLALYAFASSIFFPSVNGLVSLYTTAEQQGQTLGIFRSLNALARIMGAVLVSTVFWIYGPIITYMSCTILLGLLLIYKEITLEVTKCQSEQTYKDE
uniref:MFS domain-containing protein n=2 Tax=Schistosoma mansoni TaxID=6183 RepID=A0A5K4FAI4_SCHMA